MLCQTGCKDAVKLNAIAGIYHKIGNDEKAVEVLNAAVLLDKNYDAAKRNLASLYKKLGRDAEYKAIASTLKKESSSKNASVSTARASSGYDVVGEREVGLAVDYYLRAVILMIERLDEIVEIAEDEELRAHHHQLQYRQLHHAGDIEEVELEYLPHRVGQVEHVGCPPDH